MESLLVPERWLWMSPRFEAEAIDQLDRNAATELIAKQIQII